MKNTIFLLGAGASSNSLPTIRDIPQRLSSLNEELYQNRFQAERDPGYWGNDVNSEKHAHQVLIDDLKWLEKSSADHASVDTLAKKLYLTLGTGTDPKARENYRRLKGALTAFFYMEQVKSKPDMRYDTFLASVLTENIKIPAHIKIVTWNYDFQIEKALSSYLNEKNIGIIQDHIGVAQKFSNKRIDNKCIFKINGTTYIKNSFGGRALYSFVEAKDTLSRFYHDFSLSYNHSMYEDEGDQFTLSFAWEKDGFVDQVKKVFDSSSILVLIGYSLPFFNRAVDAQLLRQMPIEKVYIQDLFPDQIWTRLKALRPDLNERQLEKIQVSTSEKPGQFYLPSEI